MRVDLPARRSAVADTPAGFEIRIPAKRSVSIVLFLSAWLVGWAVGEVSVFREIVAGKTGGTSGMLFLGTWLAFWTVAGAWAVYRWAWVLSGSEIVRLLPDSLSIKRDTFGLGRTYEYDLQQIRNLRVSPQPRVSDWEALGSRDKSQGAIAFDYGAGTFRFGESIDEAEAAEIVSEMKRRRSFVP